MTLSTMCLLSRQGAIHCGLSEFQCPAYKSEVGALSDYCRLSVSVLSLAHFVDVDISVMSAIRSRSSSSTTINIKRPRTEGPMTVSNPAQLAPHLTARLAARKGWKDQPKWVDFYNHWWGQGEENVKGPGAVLEIQHSRLWHLLGDLEASNGKILVRDEYQNMYERMCYAFENREDMRGAIITGQPGIGTFLYSNSRNSRMRLLMVRGRAGKSYFAVFVLVNCLSKKQPVLYSSWLGNTFLFDEDGVCEKRTDDIDAADDFDRADLWSLVDTPGEGPIPLHITLEHFFLVFTSPPFRRFNTLLDHGASRWVMALWSDRELQSLCVSAYVTVFAHFSAAG